MIHLWNYEGQEAPAGNTSIFPDHFVGRIGAVGALAGLLGRDLRGRGAHVEVAQVEAPVGVLGDLFLKEGLEPGSVRATGNRNERGAPWGMYPCVGPDQWIAITVRDDTDWSALVAALGSPPWAADPALATAVGRRADHDLIDGELAAWTSRQDRYDLQRLLQDAGVPAGVMLTGSDQLTDPHLAARGYVVPTPQQDLIGTDSMAMEGAGFRGSLIGEPFIAEAPRLGEHSREVAAELGLDETSVETLLDAGVLETTPPHVPPSA